MLIISPGSAITTVDLKTEGINYLLQMWAARQVACASIFCWALFKKSLPMLSLAYVFYLVMNFGGVIIGWVQADAGLWIGASVKSVFSLIVIRRLGRIQA